MPGDPVMRGRRPLSTVQNGKELFSLVQVLETPESTNKEQAKPVKPSVTGSDFAGTFFCKNKYILGDDFSMIDGFCPLLYDWAITTSNWARTAAPLLKYAERIFQREAFIEALTPAEKAMRR